MINTVELEHNILVSKSPETGWEVVGLLDWQHASILPVFLLASIPNRLQHYDSQTSDPLIPPSLPENFSELNEYAQTGATRLYHKRLVHYEYVKNTRECNELHYAALTDYAGMLLRRLFCLADAPWEGETLELKVALVQATQHWETLAGEGVPRPIAFDSEDVRETMKLLEVQREADELLEAVREKIGTSGPEDWVPAEHYEEAKARSEKLREVAFSAIEDDEERALNEAHWPFDDMDEKDSDVDRVGYSDNDDCGSVVVEGGSEGEGKVA